MLVWLLALLLLSVVAYVLLKLFLSTDKRETKKESEHYTFKL